MRGMFFGVLFSLPVWAVLIALALLLSAAYRDDDTHSVPSPSDSSIEQWLDAVTGSSPAGSHPPSQNPLDVFAPTR